MSFGLIKGANFPLAIDFGVSSLKVLQLAPGDPPSVVVAASLDTPDELLDDHSARLLFQYDQLPKFLKELGVKSRRVVCTVSSTQTLIQHLHLPKSAGGSMRSQVAEQLQIRLQCDTSQLVLRHFEVGEVVYQGAKCQEVIAVAMPASIIESHMRAMRNCRLEVAGIHTEHLAAIRSFEYLFGQDEEHGDPSGAVRLYVDLGGGSTKVAIAHGGAPAFARTLPGARQSGDEQASEEAWAERLGDEIAQCIRYHRALFPDRRVDLAVIFGGQSEHERMRDVIARRLGLPALTASPFELLNCDAAMEIRGFDPAQPQPGWVTPVGLSVAPANA